MRLTKQEKETIINFHQKEDTAYIYTCSKVWMAHMEKKLQLKHTQINPDARTYECPKTWIRKPRKPKKLSDNMKAKLTNRLSVSSILSSKMPCSVGENEK
jgi:hypothetical protein